MYLSYSSYVCTPTDSTKNISTQQKSYRSSNPQSNLLCEYILDRCLKHHGVEMLYIHCLENID